MRPLLANPKRKSESATWHRRVFAAWGTACYFCGNHATDAMHLIPRAQLGSLRYEMPVENGRPGCRRCHERQEHGELRFRIADVRRAVRAHNKIARVPLEMP